MTKELQDLVWPILPKEFKEEVKRIYKSEYVSDRGYQPTRVMEYLASLFGHHNLTSDAGEEEDEILYVSRKKLQYFYEKLRAVGKNQAAFTLQSLFGSNCLPDEKLSQNPPENCDTENQISTDCDKPAEPTEKNPKESDETFASDNERRLNIAAMAMQGLLANPLWMKEKQYYAHTHSEDDPDKAACILIKDIAEDAMEFADALIAECEKGGTDGED